VSGATRDWGAILAATRKVLARFPGQLGIRTIWYRLISPPFQLLEQAEQSYKAFDAHSVVWRERGEIPPGRIADNSTSPYGGEDTSVDSIHEFLEDLLRQADAALYVRRVWSNQEVVPMIWVEKDTLTDQILAATEGLGVVVLPTRGVASFTKIWRLATGRMGRRVHVLYVTDHDPTGVFMEGDLRERLQAYGGEDVPMTRIALTTEQVRRLRLPSNPAHAKDSRTPAYVERFGNHAWEVDAIPPDELQAIVRGAVEKLLDPELLEEVRQQQAEQRKQLDPLLEPVRASIQSAIDESPGDGA
jgi:hypothetical protein